MAKAKGRRRQATTGARQPSNPWRWFVGGLLVGLSLSVFFIGYEKGMISLTGSGDSQARVGETHTKTPAVEKPTFEFYTMLPEMEVAVSEEELLEPANATTESAEPRVLESAYLLQVGSFRKLTDADRLKANLALLGLEAQIQTVSINGEETWHRVRVGPYTDSDSLSKARARLKENNFNAMLLKLKT